MVEETSEPVVKVDAEDPLDAVKIETFEGIGPLTMGVGGNWHIIMTALCIEDHPQVNKFLLAQKLRMSDRLTKTVIFPREGMSLPNGETYHTPEEEVKEG